jgi:AP-2 complex subunit alpha
MLLNENSELLRLIVQQLRNDLAKSDESQCLALSCIANLGGQEFAESLAGDVAKLLLQRNISPFVLKKAALCLLRLVRKFPDAIPGEQFPQKYAGPCLRFVGRSRTSSDPSFLLPPRCRVSALLDDPDIGVELCVSSLLLGLVSYNPKLYEADLPPKCINLLTRLAFGGDKRSDYKYYHTVCPWLQVRMLRLLQYFPPIADKAALQRLNHVLNEILTKTQVTRSVNKNNADHGILFEAVNLIIHMCQHG